MTKSSSLRSAINIILPRDLWPVMQSIRTKFIKDARCGPHISLVEPFVAPSFNPEAAELLKTALQEVHPFAVKLEKFNAISQTSADTIGIFPKSDNLEILLTKILEVFPQCNDLCTRGAPRLVGRRRIKGTHFLPYLSLKRCDHSETYALMEELESTWKPIEFLLKEVYILYRTGGDPFEVVEVIPLGPPECHTPPHFGPGSPGTPGTPEEDQSIGRSVVVGGLPKGLEDNDLSKIFTENGFDAICAEITRNFDGKACTFGVVEFRTKEETWRALREFKEQPFPDHTICIKHLPMMVFPGTIGDCCSQRHSTEETKVL